MMTEAVWLVCTDLTPMIHSLRGRASERKLRLFRMCPRCRRLGSLGQDQRALNAVEFAERFAEGQASARNGPAFAPLSQDTFNAGTQPRQFVKQLVHVYSEKDSTRRFTQVRLPTSQTLHDGSQKRTTRSRLGGTTVAGRGAGSERLSNADV